MLSDLMSRLAWYWHRLGAMVPGEVFHRVKRKGVELIDARRERDWKSIPLTAGRCYPIVPNSKLAPETLLEALRRDTEDILAGRWRAFGHLPIQVKDPPEWHTDHLAGIDLSTDTSAFELDYRSLPKGGDIKLIWESSRWHQLTRLGMAAYMRGDAKAGWKCVHWLRNWVQQNPAYRGWNWISALESGMRLIQFTWIDALLRGFAAHEQCEVELEQLRYDILPPHVWFTWRHKSFGSSANNHLLGELAGLILATTRWPELSAWSASMDELQELWEHEVLAQFADDGGNREQALNYHLFSFELCWHARQALLAGNREISASVQERLESAIEFFCQVQAASDHWDYGDSDDGFVLPFATYLEKTACEWRQWARGEPGSLQHMFGEPGRPRFSRAESLPEGWKVFRESGMAVNRTDGWFLRWDVSPLGYLSTAAHGHLDALHLSLWFNNVAFIIDPGTGAYYGAPKLRDWLASRAAHNGPSFALTRPSRLGPFMWSDGHPSLDPVAGRAGGITAAFVTLDGGVQRTISRVEKTGNGGWLIEDRALTRERSLEFCVLWQFAPGTTCEMLGPRHLKITRQNKTIEMWISSDWSIVEPVVKRPVQQSDDSRGVVSPRFCATTWAPYLKLIAKPGSKPCLFTTTFLECQH